MSLAQVLSTYSTLNLIVALGFLFLYFYSFVAKKFQKEISSGVELRLHYFILSSIFTITSLHPFFPNKAFFEPAAKVWSGKSLKEFPSEYAVADKGGYMSFPTMSGTTTYDADNIALSLIIIATLVLLIGGFFISRDMYRLFKIRKNSLLVKRRGRVSIYSNNAIIVPFSYRSLKYCNVIVPENLLAKSTDYKIALAHELQHHRQLDTIWVYLIWFLRIICIINPFVHLWSKWLSELQEFACDEALVGQQKFESQQYARCLIEVAETALNQKYVPVCATGLMFLTERNLLKRRIIKMTTHTTKMKSKISGIFGFLTLALMMTTAFASQGLVQDKRVTMDEARVLAAQANVGSKFPVVVNDLVLKQLNRYIGTPEGRQFFKDSLARMKQYEPYLREMISEYKMPMELLAVPLVESGYQNLKHHKQGYGSGIWMFIASTARKYNLVVNNNVDERLNVELETVAALKYLTANYGMFMNWDLAVLAYNMGENNLENAIQATGTDNVWRLIRAGYEGDKDYLPKIMAAIIIMKNPEVL